MQISQRVEQEELLHFLYLVLFNANFLEGRTRRFTAIFIIGSFYCKFLRG